MKANELRLGNIVEVKTIDYSKGIKSIWEVIKIDAEDFQILSDFNDDPDYRPVKLTEDWLLRAGFRKQINKGFVTFHNYVCMTDFYLRESFKGGYYFGFIINGRHYEFNDATNYEYVHQLQNLYFSLTGEELTFAENHNPCTSPDPDDRCENCNCWKSTRSNCS